jgi:hypothetical protein
MGALPTVTAAGGTLLWDELTEDGLVCPAGVPPETFIKAKTKVSIGFGGMPPPPSDMVCG